MVHNSSQFIYLALDLGGSHWDMAVWSSEMKEPSVRRVKGNTVEKLAGLGKLLNSVRQEYGSDKLLYSCFEIGLDGFWLHRWLEAESVINHVVSPGSLEVSQKKKRTKTDRIDARLLVRKLRQYLEGDRRAFSSVRIPTLEEEAIREMVREREKVKKEVHKSCRYLECKIAYFGIPTERPKKASDWKEFIEQLPQKKTQNGASIPRELQREMRRCLERLELAEGQLCEIEEEIREYHKNLSEDSASKKMEALKGIGITISQQICSEVMDWHRFTKRKQPGKFVGLCPTHWQSCTTSREQGIGKDGNPRLRSSLVKLAWLWRRWQPESKLTKKWEPMLKQKGRKRKMAIVALARELMTSLWRYLTTGEVIPGAIYSK